MKKSIVYKISINYYNDYLVAQFLDIFVVLLPQDLWCCDLWFSGLVINTVKLVILPRLFSMSELRSSSPQTFD